MNAEINFAPVTAVLNELKARISALTLADDVTPAFKAVELFDSEDLLAAFERLLLVGERICVIVPMDVQFTNELKVRKLLVQRTLPVTLIVSDRVTGKRVDALFGNETTDGAYALAELIIPAVTGQLLANPAGVVCSPQNTSVLILKNEKEKKNLPGRAAVALELECRGGWIEAALGPGITL